MLLSGTLAFLPTNYNTILWGVTVKIGRFKIRLIPHHSIALLRTLLRVHHTTITFFYDIECKLQTYNIYRERRNRIFVYDSHVSSEKEECMTGTHKLMVLMDLKMFEIKFVQKSVG